MLEDTILDLNFKSEEEYKDSSQANPHSDNGEMDDSVSIAGRTRDAFRLLDLPTEILVHMATYLEPAWYLIINFVCKKLNAITKNSDATSIMKLEAMFNIDDGPATMESPAYSTVMAALEAGLATEVYLETLTCSSCGALWHMGWKRGFR